MRRLPIVLFDALAVFAIAIILSAGFPFAAWAYVDPSVLTYTIQAVAGVAVALSAVAGVLFRRTRRVLMTRLGIDEDAGKIKEPSVSRLDPSNANMVADCGVTAGDAEDDAATLQASSNLSTAAKVRASAVCAFFLAFTLFFVAPIEIVVGSAGSLVVGVEQVWPVIACSAIVVGLVLTAVLALVPARFFQPARMIVICLGVCCWVQAMFLNWGLPSADGATLDWMGFAPQIAVSAIVWMVLLVGSCVAWRVVQRKRAFASGLTAVACALVLVQTIGLVSLFVPGSNAQDLRAEMHSHVVTEKGMFTVSHQDNVIVFVLDNYDTEHLMTAVAHEPALLDGFRGFTWYQNSTAAMIPTRYGVPFLLTGELPHADERFSRFLVERYDRSDYLGFIAATGATVGIYSDTLGLQYVDDEKASELVYDKAFNFADSNSMPIDEPHAALMLMRCALYRDMPWIAKPAFWFYTDEVNNALIEFDEDSSLDVTPFTMSDGRWYRQLKENGLSFDDQADRPAFRFIHLLGTHEPYTIDENGIDIGSGRSTRERQAVGSMRMVGSYLDQLKALGVYDDVTVIITADHGDWYITDKPLEHPATPIMLVKPPHAADEPCAVSDMPVAASDVMPTVLTAIGADAEGRGQPIWEIDDPDRVRHYLMTASDGSHDQEILEYEITGDALDLSNWKLTGVSWDAQQ